MKATASATVTEPRPVWLVRAGAHGEDEDASLEAGLAIIGFHDVPSLVGIRDLAGMIEHVRRATPGAKEANIRNRAAQLEDFALEMQKGDVVALPLKSHPSQIALGRVADGYVFREVGGKQRHARQVEWLRVDTPRNTFEQDLLYSLGAFMTVCRIRRHNAESRFAAVIAGSADPGYEEVVEAEPAARTDIVEEPSTVPDVAQAAHDQIVAHIQVKFREHELARLVTAVLAAEGFQAKSSPPGADGGVDILAGQGLLGLDGQRLCVQVKSSTSTADVRILRELKGTMDSFKADRGLLVSWGGFTRDLEREARQSYFQVRLWNAKDLVDAIYRTYDRLPEEIQAELPLKRVWALVVEELE
jgi:restriction system protein